MFSNCYLTSCVAKKISGSSFSSYQLQKNGMFGISLFPASKGAFFLRQARAYALDSSKFVKQPFQKQPVVKPSIYPDWYTRLSLRTQRAIYISVRVLCVLVGALIIGTCLYDYLRPVGLGLKISILVFKTILSALWKSFYFFIINLFLYGLIPCIYSVYNAIPLIWDWVFYSAYAPWCWVMVGFFLVLFILTFLICTFRRSQQHVRFWDALAPTGKLFLLVVGVLVLLNGFARIFTSLPLCWAELFDIPVVVLISFTSLLLFAVILLRRGVWVDFATVLLLSALYLVTVCLVYGVFILPLASALDYAQTVPILMALFEGWVRWNAGIAWPLDLYVCFGVGSLTWILFGSLHFLKLYSLNRLLGAFSLSHLCMKLLDHKLSLIDVYLGEGQAVVFPLFLELVCLGLCFHYTGVITLTREIWDNYIKFYKNEKWYLFAFLAIFLGAAGICFWQMHIYLWNFLFFSLLLWGCALQSYLLGVALLACQVSKSRILVRWLEFKTLFSQLIQVFRNTIWRAFQYTGIPLCRQLLLFVLNRWWAWILRCDRVVALEWEHLCATHARFFKACLESGWLGLFYYYFVVYFLLGGLLFCFFLAWCF